jgi:hypothetical protein
MRISVSPMLICPVRAAGPPATKQADQRQQTDL